MIILTAQIFFLQKLIDSLQEAFIHLPELWEAHFIMDAYTLFDFFWTVKKKKKKHLSIAIIIMFGSTRTIFNMTPIRFVWKKKVINT